MDTHDDGSIWYNRKVCMKVYNHLHTNGIRIIPPVVSTSALFLTFHVFEFLRFKAIKNKALANTFLICSVILFSSNKL